MKDCWRTVLAVLEARAIRADKEARKQLEIGKPIAAMIDTVIATEMRGLATQVEQAWKSEIEKNDT